MRVLGIDFGQRRIGLALSDASGILATPAATLDRVTPEADPVALVWGALQRLAGEEPISRIVVGLPRRLDGSDNDQTPGVRKFAAASAIVLQDWLDEQRAPGLPSEGEG